MELKKLSNKEIERKIKKARFWIWFNFTLVMLNLFLCTFNNYFGFMMLLHLCLMIAFEIHREILINCLEIRHNAKLMGFNIIQKIDRMTWQK